MHVMKNIFIGSMKTIKENEMKYILFAVLGIIVGVLVFPYFSIWGSVAAFIFVFFSLSVMTDEGVK